MARREDIVNSEWTDELLPFSADGKLLAIWSRTNRHCNLAGLYRVGLRAVRFETGLSPKRLDRALEELQRAGYLRYDDPVMWVPSRAGRFSGVNPNMAQSMARDLRDIGPHPFRREFVELYRDNKWFYSHPKLSLYDSDPETVSGPSANGSGTHRERDRDRDKERDVA